MVILSILRPFGIFVEIRLFFPVLVCFTKKNLATWLQLRTNGPPGRVARFFLVHETKTGKNEAK
jgi:hypothetical protein